MKTYTTKEVADIFEVRTETISYWKKYNKLPVCGRIGNNGSYLFSESDIVTFILDTHSGKYKNSPIDIDPVLKKLGLENSVVLPATKRFRTLFIKPEDKLISEANSLEYFFDTKNCQHTAPMNRTDYFKKIGNFGLK